MAGINKRAFVCAGFRQSQILSPGGSCSTLAIRGPRDANADCGGVTWLVVAGAVVAGAGLVAAVGVPGGVPRVFATGAAIARFRRLRVFPPSKTMRPYSATRARLVLTPCRCSKSAMAE